MLEELYNPLVSAWSTLFTCTTTWISHLHDKYAKGSSADTAEVGEALRQMKLRLTQVDAGVPKTAPGTNAEARDIATEMQCYLKDTKNNHAVLMKGSKRDPTTQTDAHAVEEAREALSVQVKEVRERTLVHLGPPAAPGITALPGSVGTSSTASSSAAPTPPVSTPLAGAPVSTPKPGAISTPVAPPPVTTSPGAPAGSPTGTSGGVGVGATGSGKTPQLFLIVSLLLANNGNNLNDPLVDATTALLAGRTPQPPLQNVDIEPLIQAWKSAIDTFTNTANWKPQPTTSLALPLGLIRLHAELEVLYDQLINIEESAHVSVTSLLSIR